MSFLLDSNGNFITLVQNLGNSIRKEWSKTFREKLGILNKLKFEN